MVKVALIIGINYTYRDKKTQLSGCIYDAHRIRNMVIRNLGFSEEDVYLLTDEYEDRVTKQSILDTIENLKSLQLRTEDELLLYYSGHGNSVMDTNGDEKYGKDSVILPSDYIENGYISDDDIHIWLQDTSCKTLLLFDSCHSGTIGDLPWTFVYQEPNELNIEKVREVNMKNTHIYALSSSLDTQTSWEVYNKQLKESYGVFTNMFLYILESHQYDVPILKLFEQISKLLYQKHSKSKTKQTPILSSSSRIPEWRITK